MESKVRRLAVALCLVVLLAAAIQPGIRPPTRNEALALPGDASLDHGDPLISDPHISFMDRGRYGFQDEVCGGTCGPDGDAGPHLGVNVVHGNLVYTRPEFSIPGRGLPLEIAFTYNSGSSFDGRYGYGWQLNYNQRYVTNDVNDNVIVVREDDRTDIFVKQADGTFQATYGVRDTLEKIVPDGYLLTDRLGVRYWFDSPDHHYVTRIEDLNGNTLILSYDPQRALVAVTDAAGRQLTLTYSGDKLASISDPLGRTWQYDYDPQGNLVQVTDPLSQTTQYGYSPDCHDLTSITDARGNVRTIAYNADYQVASVATCCGTLTLDYDLANGQTTVTDGNGHPTNYTYDLWKRVVAIEDAVGQVTTRTWDGAYNLTNLTDANGGTETYTYDAANRLLTATDALGGMTTYTWHPDLYRLASVTDARGFLTTYGHDLNGNLTDSTDALGQTTTYAYDSHGQVTSRTDPRGLATTWSYDAYGNVTQQSDALAYVSTYSYDPVGNRISETDANGYVTTYSYDALNRLLVVTDALSCTVQYSYDPVGNRISETDGNGHVTTYSYDPLNRLIQETDALGYISTYSYDPVGNRISETDANGHVTTYSYDPLNRLIKETDALGYASTYSYDPVGNRIGETDALSYTTNYSYDPLNRLIQETDALAYVSTYSYDPVGNRISETDANGHTIQYSYDPLNRLESITDALGYASTYSYDPVGNRISETDANGYTIDYSYDGLDRRIESVYAGFGYTTTYSYDPVGNLIGETDANGHTWTYEYDPLNRLITGTSPLGNQMVYGYDCAGNRTSRLDPNGAPTLYGYDAVDRLLTIVYSDTSHVDFAYDGVGNQLAMTNTAGLGEVTYRWYDAANRLVTETIDYGPIIKTVVYGYDANGQLVTLTDPDGQARTYQYDGAGRLEEVLDPQGGLTTIVRDPVGLETEVHFPNGVWTATGYDAANQATEITTRDAADVVLLNYEYTYDAVGQVLRIDKDAVQESEFGYNAPGWVTQADYSPLHNYQYTYDLEGNRLVQDDVGAMTTYLYNDEDRVLTQTFPDTSVINYFYDDNGNVIQTVSAWGVVDYEYDYENRLVGITYPVPWGAVTNYFSPEGQRLAQVDRGGLLTYYFPTLLGTVVEMDGGGNTLTRLNPGLGFVTGGIANYVHWDGSDSTTLFTDAGAAQVAAFGFGYYGEMLYGTGNVAGVDAGLYAAGMKVDWDPALGAELIDVDYAPDITQRFGGPLSVYEPQFVAGLNGQDQINDDDEEIDRPLWPDVPPPKDWPPIKEKKECQGPCRAQGWWLAWTPGRGIKGSVESSVWRRASKAAKDAADAICRERACDEKCICSGNILPGTSYAERWYDAEEKMRYYYAYVDFAGKCIKLP